MNHSVIRSGTVPEPFRNHSGGEWNGREWKGMEKDQNLWLAWHKNAGLGAARDGRDAMQVTR